MLVGLCGLLSGCAPKVPVIGKPPQVTAVHEEIARWLDAAHQGRVQEAVDALDKLAQGVGPIAEEAAFRRAQLMLQYHLPMAEEEAKKAIGTYPDHALVPSLWNELARRAAERGEVDRAVAWTLNAMKHPKARREDAEMAVRIAVPFLNKVDAVLAVEWMLAAGERLPERRSDWVQKAASMASVTMLERMVGKQALRSETGALFAEAVARRQMLLGRSEDVARIASMLKDLAPGSEAAERVAAWTEGAQHPAKLGVLLPLSDGSGMEGRMYLRGVRLALDALGHEAQIEVLVEDEGKGVQECMEAYQRLLAEGVSMILGPVTYACISQVAKVATIPIMAFEGPPELAHASPWLFLHTTNPLHQAEFLAKTSLERGIKNVAVLSQDDVESKAEAETFVRAFEALGGKIAARVVLDKSSIDHRPQLIDLRARTDDFMLFTQLDEERAYLPDPTMEMIMPVGLDGLYLAMPGASVALLAGQLAYVGMVDPWRIGTSRWRDGHLLDDRGRYLERSMFSDVNLAADREDFHTIRSRAREVWGDGIPDARIALAYDSTMIAAVLMNRLGLKGKRLAVGLKDAMGFPAITGHVVFDESGDGKKSYALFTIRRGRIVPME